MTWFRILATLFLVLCPPAAATGSAVDRAEDEQVESVDDVVTQRCDRHIVAPAAVRRVSRRGRRVQPRRLLRLCILGPIQRQPRKRRPRRRLVFASESRDSEPAPLGAVGA
jgi:hypothetical protein